ncbi:hypothetical protein PV08_08921 [Exophiala spinifera]|uniref:Uncharacterized protein n=1 Tax=Exophiala spinifera TaxID=91928 RepID=A0A0D2B4U8_9EURO|nr:uncharacterized protein PV08_08921 [Exophiala spinifera]KIW13730.1 hypothetical protein PV08_08921 [Exophiala spinifera]
MASKSTPQNKSVLTPEQTEQMVRGPEAFRRLHDALESRFGFDNKGREDFKQLLQATKQKLKEEAAEKTNLDTYAGGDENTIKDDNNTEVDAKNSS